MKDIIMFHETEVMALTELNGEKGFTKANPKKIVVVVVKFRTKERLSNAVFNMLYSATIVPCKFPHRLASNEVRSRTLPMPQSEQEPYSYYSLQFEDHLSI